MVSFSHYRIAAIVMSISAALALIACQPVSQETVPTEDVVTVETDEPKTDNESDSSAAQGMTDEEITADDNTQMTNILKDYTKSINSMRDEMMIGMSYNDPDVAFAKSMLGHHRGTLDMANIELKYGTDASMRQLAQAIILEQQIEIDTIRKWLASHLDSPKPKPNTLDMQQAYSSAMDAMHSEMAIGIADPIPDMAFARSMLPHHLGAVEMAKIQLMYGKDEEMRKLAQEIINAQQPEIELMQNWIVAYQATHPIDSNADQIIDTADSSTIEEPVKTEKPEA